METLEYKTVDKSDWGAGEWQAEPDKKQWQDTASGLPCLIVRGPSGALCGYVGVSKEHTLYEKDYNEADVEVHGGLTFADHCQHSTDESKGICHKTDGDDHVWWLGFDCAHSGDVSPKYNSRREYYMGDGYERYRTLSYVTRQVTELAAQLAAYPSRESVK